MGPQRLQPTLAGALHSLGLAPSDSVATVTAGWQEREDDDRELKEHLADRAVNLTLYRRTERVFERDPELARAFRERQDGLRQLQALYKLRLTHGMNACRELLRKEGDDETLREERRAAIDAVRDLDARHLRQVRERHAEFETRFRPDERDALARERAEVAQLVDGTGAIAVAGGHVAILLNRLRLFTIDRLVAQRPVVAWSAGAMALAERVVLFHDDPPHGAGHPEVFEHGINIAPGMVPLPHARRRLRLDDALRVLNMARRFEPAHCVPMDEGARVDWDGKHWTLPPGTRRLGFEGNIETWADA